MPIVRVNDEVSLTESSLVISQLATLLIRPDRDMKEVRKGARGASSLKETMFVRTKRSMKEVTSTNTNKELTSFI